ncbi:MAG: hypothetical protein SX243_25930, partial [Acidobacteriota bacterium]|nr:hypothetical protein [Acidobacteriota bacterium]
APGGSCEKRRSIYRRYAMEWRDCDKVSGDSPGCFSVNPRPVVERTVFHDDQHRWIESRSSGWNGAGRARVEEVVDNFESGTHRTERTETGWTATGGTTLGIDGTTGYLNVGTPSAYLPNLATPWILHPYETKTVLASAGGRQVMEASFNNKGTKTCERLWRLPFGRSSTDRVTAWTPGTAVGVNAGLAITEIRAGGDTANLSTATLCSVTGSASNGSRFQLDHTYQDLQLASTRIGGYPFSYQADIDPNTGLVKTYYAVTGQKTDYAYDGLGRLTSATPETSLHEASLAIQYFRPAGSPPWMRIRRLDAGVELTREERYFDALGRLIGETRQWPKPDGTVSTTKKEYQFHADGNLWRETTWQEIPVNRNQSTRYNLYDPFGRAFRVTQPDGQVQTHFYKGERNVKVSFNVEGPSGPQESWVRKVFDGLGREIATVTPLHRTDQVYGPTGQVISATRHSGGLSQTRQWSIDGRGLLTAEHLPEVGSGPGLGTVSYTRDALGQVRSRHDGRTFLVYTYDTGGRPTQLSDGTRLWKEWSWGTSNVGEEDFRKGKLVEAVRHNWLDDGQGGFDDWAVRESYEYGGRLGKISARETALESPTSYDPTLRQTWSYDALGRVEVVQYPECVPDSLGQLPCADGGDVVAQDFSAYWSYLGNQPLRVALNGTQEPEGLYADFEYHPNLQPFQVKFQNGTYAIYNQGTSGMARPARLQLARPVAGGGPQTLFDSGFYAYDGAGNITQIGANRYTYDETSRLLSASVSRPDAVFSADYTYDPFDNLTGYRRTGEPWQYWMVDGKN